MDVGGIATLIAAVSGAALGIHAAVRLRRTDKDAKEAKLKALAAEERAVTAEERTVAITELESAVRVLGDGLELATARALKCEQREGGLLDRVGAQEARIGAQARCIAELEERIRVLEAAG